MKLAIYGKILFGYEHKPAKSVTTKYKNVIMTSVLIDKVLHFKNYKFFKF